MARHLRPKLITPDTLRAVDREYRDLLMSLRALAALLHDSDGEAESGKAWEPVLANLLDAELNQLAVLMGDLTVALRVENEVTGPSRHIDLSRVLETAVRRTGSRVLVDVGAPVDVYGHPEIVSQTIISALSLALRVADGRVTATAKTDGGSGCVLITVPAGPNELARLEARVALLRKIIGAEGGKISVEHQPGSMHLKIKYPVQSGKRERTRRPA